MLEGLALQADPRYNPKPLEKYQIFATLAARVPAYYALILRSLTVLEGLALQADPRYKLLAKAYPYMARRLLTDPAPELRCAPSVRRSDSVMLQRVCGQLRACHRYLSWMWDVPACRG